MPKILIVLFCLIAILVIVNVILWTNFYLIAIKYSEYKPIDCSRVAYKPSQSQVDISVYNAIKLVNEHFDINYTLKFEDMQEQGLWGNTTLVLNIIRVDNDLSGWNMLYVLAHELCHIKYYTSNETFTEYMTFVELYESNNEILHNRGEWLAKYIIDYKWRINTEYDCSYYIINYLNL